MPGRTRHLHVHLILSERLDDDVGREKEWTAMKIFSSPTCVLKELEERRKKEGKAGLAG